MQWLADHGAVLGGDGRLATGGQSAGLPWSPVHACSPATTTAPPQPARCCVTRAGLRARHRLRPAVRWGVPQHQARLDDRPIPGGAASHPVCSAPASREPRRAAPALVIGAGRDPLRDDARAYATRLDADGVNVTYVEYAGTMHAFLNFCGVLSAGEHAIQLIAAELTRIFKEPSTRASQSASKIQNG